MTRLMMYWSRIEASTPQVNGPLASPLRKTIIWPRSGTYGLPKKCESETAARLTIRRSLPCRVFSIEAPTTLYERMM